MQITKELNMETEIYRACGISVTNKDSNEDDILISKEKDLFLLADGVSAASSGGKAAQLAVEYLAENYQKDKPYTIRSLIFHVDDYLLKEETKNPGLETTIVALALQDNKAQIVSVGDSKAYKIYKDGGWKIEKLNEEHSEIAEAIRNSKTYKEAIEKLPGVSPHFTIYSCLGDLGNISIKTVNFKPGDKFVLCSDGVECLGYFVYYDSKENRVKFLKLDKNRQGRDVEEELDENLKNKILTQGPDFVYEDTLKSIISKYPPKKAARKLVELAKDYAYDDFSIIIVDIKKPKNNLRRKLYYIAGSLLALGLGVSLIMQNFSHKKSFDEPVIEAPKIELSQKIQEIAQKEILRLNETAKIRTWKIGPTTDVISKLINPEIIELKGKKYIKFELDVEGHSEYVYAFFDNSDVYKAKIEEGKAKFIMEYMPNKALNVIAANNVKNANNYSWIHWNASWKFKAKELSQLEKILKDTSLEVPVRYASLHEIVDFYNSYGVLKTQKQYKLSKTGVMDLVNTYRKNFGVVRTRLDLLTHDELKRIVEIYLNNTIEEAKRKIAKEIGMYFSTSSLYRAVDRIYPGLRKRGMKNVG